VAQNNSACCDLVWAQPGCCNASFQGVTLPRRKIFLCNDLVKARSIR
jgi:hypothetical protein